ncbi:MAG: aminotransferase class V-fold PLP-dependent enzyme, partial [Candidatus Zixiibacteriota bacterium]
EWWMFPRQIGDKIGALLGAAPDSISIQANVTSAQAVILSSLEVTPERNKVVMVDMEFPSILYFYRQSLRGRGEVVTIKSPDGISIPLDEFLEAIDEHTALVPISHTLFRSSCIVDAQAIIGKAHSVGALVALDLYQSAGVYPIDLGAINVDFAVGGTLKWLCGGPGVAFLYVRPDLAPRLQPRFTGWMAHESPFEFETADMRYAAGSYRFHNGTPVIPALYACQAGLEIIAEIGVERIRERSIEMTTALIELADERGWKTTAPRDHSQRGGTVAIDLPDGLAIATELNAQDFLVDYRPQAGVRISPHFYNTDQELVDVIDKIAEIVASGAHRKHLSADRTVS